MQLRDKFLETEYIYKGDVVNLRRDKILSPANNECFREVVEHPGGACVIALTDDKRVPMVTQYRRPVDYLVYEVPAGKLEKGEDPLLCATRELEEETGYCAKNIEFLGYFHPTPGCCDEKIYIYFATGLYKGKVNLDQDEFLEVTLEPLSDLVKKVMKNEIKDSKTVIAVLMAEALVRERSL